MAVDLGPQKPPPKYERFVEDQLARARGRIRALDAAGIGLVLLLGALAYCLVMTLLDQALQLPAGVRLAAFVISACAVILYLVRAGYRLLSRRINPYYAAKQIEQTLPDAKNSVVNWLDLRAASLPPVIRGALGQRAARDLKQLDLEQAISGRRTAWLGWAALALAVGVIGLAVLGGGQFLSLLKRAFAPFQEVAIASRTSLVLIQPENGDATVPVGRPVRFRVQVDGRVPAVNQPDSLRLHYRYNPTDPYIEQPLEADLDGVWTTTLHADQVQAGVWYKISGGDTETPEYQVRVRSQAQVIGFEVRYHYRPYRRLPDQVVQYPNADAVAPHLNGLRGTEITLTARANRPVKEGWLEMELTGGKKIVPGEVRAGEPDKLQFRFPLEQSGTYSVQFTTRDRESNTDRDPYTITVIADGAPRVELTKPGRDVQLPANGTLALEGWAGDDFGITQMTLRLRVSGGPILQARPYRAGKSFQLANGSYPIKLDYKDFIELEKVRTEAGLPFALKPGMEFKYWLEATDNCDYPKAQVGRSKEYAVKIVEPSPSPEQQKQRQVAQQAQQQHEQQQDQKLEKEGEQAPGNPQNGRGTPREGAGQGANSPDQEFQSKARQLEDALKKQEERDSASGQGKGAKGGQQGADKQGADKQGADKQSADKQGADKQGADKQGADKQGADKQGKQGADKQGADKQGADKQGADKQGADKQGADKQGADKQGADKQGADKQGADKQGADKQGADKQGADKQGADKQGADKQGADKQGADKQGADKQGANKPGADKQGADKQGADKQGADKQGADKQGAGEGANQSGAPKQKPMLGKGSQNQQNNKPGNTPADGPKAASQAGEPKDSGGQSGSKAQQPKTEQGPGREKEKSNKAPPQAGKGSDQGNGQPKTGDQQPPGAAQKNGKPGTNEGAGSRPGGAEKEKTTDQGVSKTASDKTAEQEPKEGIAKNNAEGSGNARNATKEDVAKLKEALKGRDAKQAAEQLSRMSKQASDPEVRKAAEEALKEGRGQARKQALEASAKDVERLKQELQDASGRKDAAEALSRIADQARDPQARKAAREALEEAAKQARGQAPAQKPGKTSPGESGASTTAKNQSSDGQTAKTPQKGPPTSPNQKPSSEDGQRADNSAAKDTSAQKQKNDNPGSLGQKPGQWDTGNNRPQAVNDDASRRGGVLQLEDLKKKVTPELLKELNWTKEDWQKFQEQARRYEAAQKAKPPLTDKDRIRSGNSQLPSVAPRQVGTGPESRSDVSNRGQALPPPEFREAQDIFTSRPSRKE